MLLVSILPVRQIRNPQIFSGRALPSTISSTIPYVYPHTHPSHLKYNQLQSLLHLLDIDECGDGGNGSMICPQVCVNDPGAFHCDCYSGYIINSDVITCSG